MSVAADSACTGDVPLFVVGMPRSGTKLLRELLTQHPRIRIPDFETAFLPFLVRWVRERGEPDDVAAFAQLYEALHDSMYFSFRDAGGRPFDAGEWRGWCAGRYDAAGLFEGFVRYELQIEPSSGVIWGDKSPNYITCVDLILEHFPRARVVHLVRDVRDYCVSMHNAWNKDILRAAQRWGEDVSRAHRHCARYPDQCIELRYEDMLRSPHDEVARLCQFLRIPFYPELVQLQRSVESIGDARGRAEIVRDNHSKFLAALSPRKVKAIESLAWTTMRQFHYAPMFATKQSHLGRASLTLRRLKDGVQLVRRDAAEWGWRRAVSLHAQHQLVSRM